MSEPDKCDCGRIEHGRHHMNCPAMNTPSGASKDAVGLASKIYEDAPEALFDAGECHAWVRATALAIDQHTAAKDAEIARLDRMVADLKYEVRDTIATKDGGTPACARGAGCWRPRA